MYRLVPGPWTRPRYAAPLFVGLVLAGLAGNYFKFPIFLNIDFLFGSVFAMLVLQFFGLRGGVLAAALIASYTLVLWNHPYAIIIMTAEVGLVGTLMARRKMGMVMADTLYWIVIGMPLVYIFYHVVMKVPLSSTAIIMTKQAVNGIANALLARLVFTGFTLDSQSTKMPFREMVYNLLAAFVLLPALLTLAVSSRADFAETDRLIRTSLVQDSKRLHHYLENWVANRKRSLLNLADLASVQAPQQMQARLEQAQKSDSNFLRFGLMDMTATSVAYYPLVTERGLSTLGENFADRPFIADLKRTLKPMVSEVLIDRVGPPVPMVAARAPVLVRGQYSGYVTGILSLRQLHEQFAADADADGLLYTLIDKNGNVIMSNRSDQTVMQAFRRQEGQLRPLDANISQWVPKLLANVAIPEQWKDSFYVAQTAVGDLAEWRLLLEQPVAPFQKTLYGNYTGKLTLLFVILLAALALAEFLSRRIVATLDTLSQLTHRLPARLETPGALVDWPETSIKEPQRLINNFKQMAESLSLQFDAVRRANATLEERVAQRTRELQISEDKHRQLIDNSHDIIYTLNAAGVFTFVSAAWTTLLGHPAAQVVGQPFKPFVHRDDVAGCMAALTTLFKTGQRQAGIEYRVRHRSGSWRWHSSNATPLLDASGEVVGFQGTAVDITERKQVQDQVRQLAFHDALTQLPNRRLFSDRLGQALLASKRTGVHGAVMFLDLDNFKPLNDEHGHGAGDLLLAEVAQRLKNCVRERDTVARIGGDEFVVMLGELDVDRARSQAQASVIAEKIRRSLCEPYHLVNQNEGRAVTLLDHHCTASIGVVLFMGDEASQDDILKWADLAMYQAKDAGRNVVRFHGAPG
ncbi:MAG: diguanylate cyclase domain-containing protein [Rhodoferax sp.]